MAVQRHPPFQEKDRCFRDTVIYLSAIDHLRDAPQHVGAFVSQDKIFKDKKVAELTTTTEVQVEVYEKVDEVLVILRDRLEAIVKKQWEEHQQHAASSLDAMRARIERFIAENLEIPEWQLGVWGRLIAIPRIKVLSITNVRTPPPIGREPDKSVRISFEAEINLYVLVEAFPLPRPRTLKVGEETLSFSPLAMVLEEVLKEQEASPLTLPAAARLGPKWEELKLQRVVEVEATATVINGEYRDIQLVSVRLK